MGSNNKTRLALYLAKCGIASRRQAEKLIENGDIAVDGVVVDTPVFFVEDHHTVTYYGKEITPHADAKLWLYHKPIGLVTTHHDPQGRPTVFDDLKHKIGEGHLISVGRLDVNSQGLLLITNSGELANRLEKPSSNFERIYHVCVFGEIEDLLEHFTQENLITIEDTHYRVNRIEHICKKACKKMANHWLEFSLYEGKNREIRRICNYFDLQVKQLIRLSFGPFKLGSLQKGNVKAISLPSDIASLIQDG